uniref:Uncharacterized protein n=1 Tax=viral metagenome TaxID=1070528 RepID=A0A6C0ENH3_9ZZZZ
MNTTYWRTVLQQKTYTLNLMLSVYDIVWLVGITVFYTWLRPRFGNALMEIVGEVLHVMAVFYSFYTMYRFEALRTVFLDGKSLAPRAMNRVVQTEVQVVSRNQTNPIWG